MLEWLYGKSMEKIGSKGKKGIFFSMVAIFIVLLFTLNLDIREEAQFLQSDLESTQIRIKILNNAINDLDNKYFETSVENIIYFMAYDEIKILIENLLIEKDISISRFLYVSNKFSALSIYFNIYNNGEKNEPVAKIFPSGKINIDGCNDPKNAPIIFEWIKKLLNTNKQLTWCEETWGMDCYLDTEFSMSDSE